MKRRLGIVIGILTGSILTVCLWVTFGPAPIDPVAYHPPQSKGFVDEFAVNNGLASAELIELLTGVGPEDVAVDSEGRIYGGLHDGHVVRILPDGTEQVFAKLEGGRPLGLHFDSDGNLIVADAWKGLLSISRQGEVSTLTTTEGGMAFGFTDDLDIASDGKIYFSDASSKFRQPQYELDLLEARAHGRLLVYDPSTGETTRLLDGLYFANGVALSTNEDFVLVNESGRYRITRYWLKGEKAGSSDIFIDNLPGFPDGISSNRKGIFWLAIPAPRVPQFDAIHPRPFLKRLITMLPLPKPEAIRYGLVVALDEDGQVVDTFHDSDGSPIYMVTSVEQVGDHIYLGSLEASHIARMPVPDKL